MSQFTGRAVGLGMSPSTRLRLVGCVRALWAADPAITISDMVRRTQCPAKLVQRIRNELVQAGALRARNESMAVFP